MFLQYAALIGQKLVAGAQNGYFFSHGIFFGNVKKAWYDP